MLGEGPALRAGAGVGNPLAADEVGGDKYRLRAFYGIATEHWRLVATFAQVAGGVRNSEGAGLGRGRGSPPPVGDWKGQPR